MSSRPWYADRRTSLGLIQSLIAISWGRDGLTDESRRQSLYTDFKNTFLDYASETPDNLAFVESLELGVIEDDEVATLSLMPKGKSYSVTDVFAMGLKFGTEVPPAVQEQFPDLTFDEWQSCIHLVVVILTMFECRGTSQTTDEQITTDL